MSAAALLLAGIQPEPLGSYLKSLGVLRVVARQIDPSAAGHWTAQGFVLTSTLDLDDLVAFFTTSYVPTPAVSPWNGGSGFHPKDNQDGIGAIEGSTDVRLEVYRSAIAIGRRLLTEIPDLKGLPPKEQKQEIIEACRSHLPDAAVRWMDAAVVLLDGDVGFPPLLGTGGNDGRLDFSNNFMQRLASLLGLGAKPPKGASPEQWFRCALDGTPVVGIKAAIGQFDPGAAGGPNSGVVNAADSIVNPADFVLLVEGATVVSSGSTKRLGSATSSIGTGGGAAKRAAMPFTFSATAAGYPSAVEGEDGRGELWMPLWDRPAQFSEIERLFSEARCTWSGRAARSGLDAARAAVTLGVDRGIDTFTRCAFLTRNGLATVAVPVGRVAVADRPEVRVLSSLDRWLEGIWRAKNQPNALGTQVAALERSMFAAASSGGPMALLDALATAASVDAVVATAGAFQPAAAPLWLDAKIWADVIVAGGRDPVAGAEVRLAAGLASLYDRTPGPFSSLAEGLRPVRHDGRRLVWTERPLVAGLGRRPLQELLAQAHDRRWVIARQGERSSSGGLFLGGNWVSPGDATAVANGEVDIARLGRYLSAFLLLDWSRGAVRVPIGPIASSSPAFALIAPGFGAIEGLEDKDRPHAQPTWAARLSTGSPNALTVVLDDARRRISMAGWRPLVSIAGVTAGVSDPRWLSTALLLRMSPRHRRYLLEQVAAQPTRASNGATANGEGS